MLLGSGKVNITEREREKFLKDDSDQINMKKNKSKELYQDLNSELLSEKLLPETTMKNSFAEDDEVTAFLLAFFLYQILS